MRLQDDREWPFNKDVPIHNWYYPLAVENLDIAPKGVRQFFDLVGHDRSVRRALYLHVPFCETICSFCPFVRKSAADNEFIETYFSRLLLEIRSKSELNANKITAIFVGGGTPSLLSEQQIEKLGSTIADCFDLSDLREFSFEMEVKSVTRRRLAALKAIGVTNVRLGVQTLQNRTRELFDLTASAYEAKSALATAMEYFDLVSADMLFSFDGQTVEDLNTDLKDIIATGVPLIDLYPLNPVVSQTRLHKRARRLNLFAPTASMRHHYRVVATGVMSDAGYVPHNGHGFILDGSTSAAAVAGDYHFDYHEHVYGYKEYEILGFGANAISNVRGMSLQNTGSIHQYIRDVSEFTLPRAMLGHPDKYSRESRPLIFRLPYFGTVEKEKVDFLNVYPETIEGILALIQRGLIEDVGKEFRMTELGWLWYANCMYFLLPQHEKKMIDAELTKNRDGVRTALNEENLRFHA
jgi:oxygen-independent coproporphyrinogen-3 oxidase